MLEMKMWIARDKDGELYIYNKKPQRNIDKWGAVSISNFFKIPKTWFPTITWETDPKIAKLKLKKNQSVDKKIKHILDNGNINFGGIL